MSQESVAETRLDNVNFHIACTEDDLAQAFRLVYKAYIRSGLMLPNASHMRITPYHLLHTTEVLVAKLRDQVICTATLVGDGIRGLPLDQAYSAEVNQRRDQGLAIAEVSCLADRRNEPGRGFRMLCRLMSLIAQVARRREIDVLLVAVHPHHEGFYQRYLGFERFGDERTYQSVRNNPAVALELDLNNLQFHSPSAYRRLFEPPFPVELLEPSDVSEVTMEKMRSIVLGLQPAVPLQTVLT